MSILHTFDVTYYSSRFNTYVTLQQSASLALGVLLCLLIVDHVQ